MFSNVKTKLKRFLPAKLVKPFLPFYHWLRAFTANAINGFPSHGIDVIGVTGTNGKTTTTAIISEIFVAAGYKVGVSSTAFYRYGEHIEINDTNMTVTNPFLVQKALRKMRKADVDIIVLEVTSHALSQSRVFGIKFKAAVMTNLTQDHLDYHKTIERYATAKARLFAKRPDIIVLNHDDKWFDFFNRYEAKKNKVTYGANKDADMRIMNITPRVEGNYMTLKFKDESFNLESPLIGSFNGYNVTAASTVALMFGVDIAHIQAGVIATSVVPGRMEQINIGQDFTMIVDYAHTADALENVLSTLKSREPTSKLILVFGATGDRDKSKSPEMGKVAAKYADHIVLTDDEPYSENPTEIRRQVMEGIKEAGGLDYVTEVSGRREAITDAISLAAKGDVVLLAGMGHQKYMTTNTGKIPWDDRQVARELILLQLES